MTGVNPAITVSPVVNPDGTLSYTEFDVTFTGVSGAQSKAAMVVTNAADENGVGIGFTTYNTDASAGMIGIPTGSTASQVSILKESGNEFQVNPQQPTSIYNQTTQPLNSDQPAVSMNGSGNFVIAWREAVSPSLAPKDVTDIYFQQYEPTGMIDSFNPGTYVPGEVTSDIVTSGEATTDPAEYAAQAFTGVRLLPNPTVSQVQQITFGAAISGTTFQLELGSVLTGTITFALLPGSTQPDLPTTASNIQNALVSAGFTGATVAVVTPSVQTVTPTSYTFRVTFAVGTDQAPIQYVPAAGAAPVTFTQSDVTSTYAPLGLYTFQANASYTNAQFNPAVAMNIYGNFSVVWATQGQDVSYFNDIIMQCLR